MHYGRRAQAVAGGRDLHAEGSRVTHTLSLFDMLKVGIGAKISLFPLLVSWQFVRHHGI